MEMFLRPFLLFGGDVYYASGGWKDFRGAYGTLAEAQAALADDALWHSGYARDAFTLDFMWYHIVDWRTGQIVAQSEKPAFRPPI